MKRSISMFVSCLVVVCLSGCTTPFTKAMKSFDKEKVMGTNDPSFILSNEKFLIKSGQLDSSDRVKEVYLSRICERYNDDKTLKMMHQDGLIQKPPVCIREIKSQNGLIVDAGSVRNDCTLGVVGFKCQDKYIRYLSSQGDLLSYSEVKNIHWQDHVDYTVGHIKNMVITANLKAKENDPEYVRKIEKYYKKYGE